MSDDRYCFGFGQVAEHYERARPPYAGAAVDWALEGLGLAEGARVLDLAAGTGLLTRALVDRGLDVVAVEPDEEMRAVLMDAVPGVEALAGRAEEIPLSDASVDAVTVGQAFHWFETERALAEMHRVIRPSAGSVAGEAADARRQTPGRRSRPGRGGFALLWNQFNRDDPLLAAVDELLRARDPARRSRWRERYDSTRFGPLQENALYERRPMTADQLAAWAASTSRVIAATPQEQVEIDREVRRLAAASPGSVTIRTHVVVAARLS